MVTEVGWDTSNPDFKDIPPEAICYCDHCGWKGEKPKDDQCPQCKAWGRIHQAKV